MKSLLLHTCCAPCAAYVYESLKDSYGITFYFFNPNISPRDEYTKRFNELNRFAQTAGAPLIEEARNVRDWVSRVKKYRFEGERSQRCYECYAFRLEGACNYAGEHGFDAFTTVLSISPHKDATKINAIGKDLEKASGVEFIKADFKKKDGFKKSLQLSKAYGFYRQEYCGCMYSRLERDKNSWWSAKLASSSPVK